MGKYSNRRLVKRYFNFPEWLGADALMGGARTIKDLYRSVTTFKREHRCETFEQAVERLNLTEERIVKRRREFFWMSIFYTAVALATLAYGYYGYTHGYSWSAVTICVLLSFMVSVYAMREHFWYVQMSKRKLGVSFNEWLQWWFNRSGAVAKASSQPSNHAEPSAHADDNG